VQNIACTIVAPTPSVLNVLSLPIEEVEMRKTVTAPSANFNELLSDHRIVGEVDIQNHHYLILTLEPHVDGKSLDNLHQSSELLEVIRFEVNGCLCAIVKTESELTKAASDLARLLSKQELQIATLIALGKTNKQVASQLRISEWTVATYLRRIFAKVGVDSRAAMVYSCASLIQQLDKFTK
jgi:DNA-binding NarL/FixJ family response regulator